MLMKYEMHNRKGLHCKNCSNEDEMTMDIWRNSDDDKMLKLWRKVETMMKIWQNCDDDDDDGDDDEEDDDDDDDDEDDIYIMMQCLSVTKNEHFLKRSVWLFDCL